MKSQHLALVLLITLALIWGSSFILIKKAVKDIPPLIFVSLRVGVTGLLFLPLVIKHRKRINWSKWHYLLGVGLLGSLIPFTLYAIAQTKVPSSVAGMINALTPVFTLIIGVMLFKTRVQKHQLLGAVLGFIGAILLISNQDYSLDSFSIYFGLFMIIATICYGTNINIVKSKLDTIKTIDVTSVSFVFATIPCLIYLLMPNNIDFLTKVNLLDISILSTIMLIVIGTFAATILFFKIINLTNALFASSTAYLIPIIALFWGVIDGEELKPIYVIGISFILVGVYLIKTSKSNYKTKIVLRYKLVSNGRKNL